MSIVICFDGSESAKYAVAVAHDTLAHHPAILLHVWNPPDAVLADAISTRGGPHLSADADRPAECHVW